MTDDFTAWLDFYSQVYSAIARQGVLVALLLLVLFGWLRYDYFLGASTSCRCSATIPCSR